MNDRARVPFALVGVLLLVGSATLSGALGGVDPVAEPATEAAMEEARTQLGGELRDATRAAAHASAAEPFVSTGNSTLGRALASSGEPFRSALALRTYLAVRDRLGTTRARGVTVSASLPRLSTEADLQTALDRMTVERVGENGTVLRTTLRNVTLTARRDGDVIERITVSPTVSVATPVLLLHERVERFDGRLDASAVEPGLARRATGRLYAVAWGRGLAQYGGAPVANVVANRHVALATNDALLAEQRTVFGAADDVGVRATRTAAARAAGTDLLTAAGLSSREAATIIERADRSVPNSTLDPITAGEHASGQPDDRMRIDAASAARAALRPLVDERLNEVLAATYRVHAERRVRVRTVDVERYGRAQPRGENWTLVGSDVETVRDVEVVDPSVPNPAPPWHVLTVRGRLVTERRTTERLWRRGNRSTRKTATVVTRNRVRVALVGRHDGGPAPRRGVRPVHDRGGALDGPNLGGVTDRITTRLLTERGGADAVARRAVTGEGGVVRTTLVGARPSGLRAWVYRDLVALRTRIANVSVSVTRGDLGTYRVNPPARLAAALRDRRAELVAAPNGYDGVSDRARVAVRAAYVDAVVAELESRAIDHRRAGDGFESSLAEFGLSREWLGRLIDARTTQRGRTRRAIHGVGGEYRLVVEGTPAYLTLSSVPRSATDARGTGADTPLVARNLNLFTVPYGDVADSVVGRLFGADRVRLRSAARALRSVNGLTATSGDPRLAAKRDRLRAAVDKRLEARRSAMRATLAEHGVGDATSERRRVVTAALSRWNSTAARGLSMVNGSAAVAVAEVARRHSPDAFSTVETRDRLRLELRAATTTGKGVPEPAVNESVTAAKRVATRIAERAADRAAANVGDRLERRLGRSLARVPAGVPVSPVPTQWYVTTNVWLVEVRGSYDRFAVRTRRGTPGTATSYVRNGTTVGIDWDEDGTVERAGRADEVDISVETVIVVVVPPGGQGVGDTDGNADERSAGWSERPSVRASPMGLKPPTPTAAHVPRTRRGSRRTDR